MLPVAETLTYFAIFSIQKIQIILCLTFGRVEGQQTALTPTARARKEDLAGGPHERSGHRYGTDPLPGGQPRLRAHGVPELSGTLQLHTLERQQCRVQASHQRLASRECEFTASAFERADCVDLRPRRLRRPPRSPGPMP